jgi:hypothetical protein
LAALRIIVPAVVSAVLAAASPVTAETAMRHAKGPFDVATKPVEQDKGEGSTLGRFSLDKTYHGALEATGKGEMLTVGTDVQAQDAKAVPLPRADSERRLHPDGVRRLRT